MTYLDGLKFAESRGYFVKDTETTLKSFSVTVDGLYGIAINEAVLNSDELVEALYHELGHCETGAFYNNHTPFDVRQKHENRADKWAIKRLIPKGALDNATSKGYTETWQLAEFFSLPESFIKKAVCLYKTGSLSGV